MWGKGVFINIDGRRYIGDFERDKKNGIGLYIWIDNRIYYGNFKDGK